MTGPTVKIIKGTGATLSLAQLEKASAKLLISRIRGHEPQVSFTFIQRLLDELIRRRRDEADLVADTESIAEALEKDEESDIELDESARYETLMSADIEVIESIDDTGSDELEIPEEVLLAEDSPLRAMVEPISQEEVEDRERDGRAQEPAKIRQLRNRRVLACSRPKTSVFQGDMNVQRILIIAVLAIVAMIIGVLVIG